MLRLNMNNPQYVNDLADAGIISDAQKMVYLERIRLAREQLQKRVAEMNSTTKKNEPQKAEPVKTI